MENWLSILQTAVVSIAALMIWTHRHAFMAGGVAQRFAKMEVSIATKADAAAVTAVEKRMERAGTQTSDLASDVQGMPERWRAECLTRREFEIITTEMRVERERMQRSFDEVWAEIRRRKDTR